MTAICKYLYLEVNVLSTFLKLFLHLASSEQLHCPHLMHTHTEHSGCIDTSSEVAGQCTHTQLTTLITTW